MKNVDLVFLQSSCTLQATICVDKHLDGYYTIQYMARGGVELFYDDQRYDMEGRWFWPAYPGPHIRFHVHATRGYTHWEHRHLAFRGPLIHRWISEGLFSLDPQPAPPDKEYRTLFDALALQAKQTDYWGVRRAINMLEALLLDLAEHRAQTRREEIWLRIALEQLSNTTEFAPDYEKLAHECDMSLSSLRRRFREATGTSLHHYVLQCRTARARQLLEETDLPVKSIAHELGYSDIYFFSRQFHEQTGVSPLTYRRSRQG